MSLLINSSASNPLAIANNQYSANAKRQNIVASEIELPKDEIKISEEGRKLQQENAGKTSEGLEILKSDSESGKYTIRFKNWAYVHQAIERGSITVRNCA